MLPSVLSRALCLSLLVTSSFAQRAVLINRLGGSFPDAMLGEDVALIGDLDGDGHAEWMVGRGGSQPGETHGELRVHSGASGALLYTIAGPGVINSLFLESIVALGDVDADGVGDFAFGNANAVIGGQANVGELTVYSGASGARLYRTSGVLFFGGFGASAAVLGDVTGDAVPDFVVGQIGTLDENAWIVSGVDGSLVFRVRGPQGLGDIEFGYSTAGPGDLDGDGVPDFAVGTHSGRRVMIYSGATGAIVRTILGGASFGRELAAIGDLDGDGWGELLVGAPSINEASIIAGSDGSILWSFNPLRGIRFGTSVAAAGDVDLDGTPDFLVGDDRYWGNRGRVQIFSGRFGWPIAAVTGQNPLDRLGRSCAGGFDVNADGRPDFIVGAPRAEGPGMEAGVVSIWSLQP